MVALALFYLFFIFHCSFSHKEKNLNDLSDAELDRIDKEWNEEEEELDDELRMPPKLKPGMDKEDILKATKKNQPLMIFANLAGNPSKEETELVSMRWQQGLLNGHLSTQRFVVQEGKVIFMIQDGEQAWQVKDFLVQQPECIRVDLENQHYPGLHHKEEL